MMTHLRQILVACYLVSALFSTSVHVKAITNPQNLLYNQCKVTNNYSIRYDITYYAAGYKQFIENVRTMLTYTVSHGIPVLRPQPPSVTPSTVLWLTVLLVEDGKKNITVCLDSSNLYVRGYSRNGVSWEFSDSSLIPNSRTLGFSGSYAGSRGLEKTGERNRLSTSVGYNAFQNAVYILATTENPKASPREPARSLLVLVQMVAEAARINIIADSVRNNWLIPQNVTPRMVYLENQWRKFSWAVQQVDQSAADNTLLPDIPPNNPGLVSTLGEAAVAFGILLLQRDRGLRGSLSTEAVAETASLNGTRVLMNLEYVRVNNIDGESPGDLFGMVRIDDGWYGYPTGISTLSQAALELGILLSRVNGIRVLMNLEYVMVDDIDGKSPGDLFGTVRVDDGWYNYTFYDRSSENSESKGPGGFATLTDPFYYVGGAISGEDAFDITVNLFDYDTLSANDEIARGEVVWDPIKENINYANYNRHLQSVVTGRYGRVTVGYAVMSDALSAVIDVVLIDGDGESPVDVYGSVRASQVLGGSAGVAAMSLFDRSAQESVKVRPQWSIPLTRKIVAASVYAPLTVTVDLWDYDTSSPDDPIGQGSVDFVVKVGTEKSNVFGKYGQVQVSVTCE